MQAAQQGQNNNNNQQQQVSWFSTISRFLLIYLVIQYFFSGKGNNSTVPTKDVVTGKALPPHKNAWEYGVTMEMYSYLSDAHDSFRLDSLFWEEKDLTYDWNDNNYRHNEIELTPNHHMLHNGTVYIHTIFTRGGKTFSTAPVDDRPGFVTIDQEDGIDYQVHAQVRYMKPPKASQKKNLLSTEKPKEEVQIVATNPEMFISYWNPNLTLHLITDHTPFTRGSIPPQFSAFYHFDPNGNYLPIIYFDEFWTLKEYLIPINETVTTLPLRMTYAPLSLIKWQLQLQMEESLKAQSAWTGETDEMGNEVGGDEFKRMLAETSPWLLGLTFTVSMLHTIFDFLAFKNDIQFWKNNKSMEGLSVQTIILNTICQAIIFLYLLDNDTSTLILVSAGIGLLIEAWKIKKAMNVKVYWVGSLPRLSFTDKASYSSETKKHDQYAMKKLSYVLYVLVIGSSIYSLIYNTHKSWYSWILSSLVSTVYTFGFIMMTPQLFINYKLKSVAHLPWRVFMYKALNTFIDDLFAFIIKMPTLHRLSCLRDDLIFVIYLYQRWIYPVDKTRVNEFGQSFEDENKPGTSERIEGTPQNEQQKKTN
eukprot:TRINITY_DN1326_c0_g2_i6.p1 TRINITY_DN1326_c0_g2~~TRINITY_DN1326_c0_g2_i6.p1  ORF type:complete len:589 (+),score=121.76 TRINITY_DN1326_c0_g2_i6:219-1985(+)